jgi:hypothetical protein
LGCCRPALLALSEVEGSEAEGAEMSEFTRLWRASPPPPQFL